MTIDDKQDFSRRLKEMLAADGLDLFTVETTGALDPGLARALERAAHREGLRASSGPLSVVTVGNRGGAFWSRVPKRDRAGEDPVDEFSTARVRRAFSRVLDDASWALLYPGNCDFSLLRLGTACGWGRSSWLGINVHSDFGTWFAFRAVVATTASLPRIVFDSNEDVCGVCATRDCVAACPVDAPGPIGAFNVNACVDHRLEDGSDCESRCIARERCPVGAENRYPRDLIGYFYGRSLRSLRAWRPGPGRRPR